MIATFARFTACSRARLGNAVTGMWRPTAPRRTAPRPTEPRPSGSGPATPYFAILLLLATTAHAQQIGQNAPSGSSTAATFTANTRLVVEAVIVTDKKGSPMEGLTAKDFSVTENGVAQEIRFFERQTLPQTPGPAPAPTLAAPEHIHIYDKLGRTQISSETPGSTRYKDRRLLALYFDMSAMPPGDQLRALAAAEKFIRTQMTPADLLALLTLHRRRRRRLAGFHRRS